MSGGEVLCTALIAWLRNGEDRLEVSQKVVEMVWPRACAGWPQTHHPRKIEGATKLELLSEIEKGLREYSARCKKHLTKLGYYCHDCQHSLCTVCKDIEGRTQCPRCQTPFPAHGPGAPATSTHPCPRTSMPQSACFGRAMDRRSVGRGRRADTPGGQP